MGGQRADMCTSTVIYLFVQPLCSCIQQPHTSSKVQYPVEDVLQVTWFYKM